MAIKLKPVAFKLWGSTGLFNVYNSPTGGVPQPARAEVQPAVAHAHQLPLAPETDRPQRVPAPAALARGVTLQVEI
jgi:hypothetical protein